jgi:predicted metal-binding transcription factor (methanogenesis marker protein 9)
MVTIHDVSIDEVIVREMNDEEYAEWQARVAENNAAKAAEAQAEAQAEADKAALLAKLGITADEAKLLLS